MHYNFADLFEAGRRQGPRPRRAHRRRRAGVTYRELEDRVEPARAPRCSDAGVERRRPRRHLRARTASSGSRRCTASTRCGPVSVNVNFRYVEEELRYLFDNSDLVALVVPARVRRRSSPRPATRSRSSSTSSASSGTAPTPTTRALDPIEFEAAIAVGLARARLRRALRRRHLPALHRRHHRHAQGRDVAPGRRVLRARRRHRRVHQRTGRPTPSAASEKIDASQPQGTVMTADPAAHARRRPVRRSFRVDRSRATPRCIVDKFDAEEIWRLVEQRQGQHDRRHRRRDGAPARRRARGDAATTSTSRRCSRSAAPRRSSRRPSRSSCSELLPDHLVMTDAIGSTETGMNGIRFVQKGDAPKEGITTVQASADTVVLDDDLNPIEPGSGVVGRLARGGNIPLGYYNDPEQDRGDVRHRRAGPALVDPRRLRDASRPTAGSRCSAAARSSINSGGEKVYPRRGRGRAEVAPRRVRRARRRRARRAVGRAGHRVAAGPRRAGRRRSRSCRTHCRDADRRATRCRASCSSSTRSPRLPERQARLPRARTRAGDLAASERAPRVGSRRNPTHGELGGTGLRGWPPRRGRAIGAPPPTPRTCSG